MSNSRIETVLDMMASLAKTGVKHQRYDINVSPEEWRFWHLERVKMQKWAEYIHDMRSIDIYGPCGLLVRVTVRT